MSWVIERLARRHDRKAFDCGKPPLNDFITRYARQYEKRNEARTSVLVNGEDPKVLGYFSLTASSIPFEQMPEEISRQLGGHPLPAILLARLAVDLSVRGQGLGGLLLREALARSLALSEQIGIFAVTVDAIDDEAARFYERFGFIRFADQPDKLFLPIDSIRSTGTG